MGALPGSIRADDLLVRPWVDADVEPIAALIADSLEHLRPWMAWATAEPISPALRRGMFARWDRDRRVGERAVSAVEVAGELVGGCTVRAVPDAPAVEIGYWLGRPAVGRGIATRVAAALTEASLAFDGIDEVRISHSADNDRSAAVARRLGFTETTADRAGAVRTWSRSTDEA